MSCWRRPTPFLFESDLRRRRNSSALPAGYSLASGSRARKGAELRPRISGGDGMMRVRWAIQRGAVACLASAASLPTGPAIASASHPAPPHVDLSHADRCDFIGQQAGSRCLLPFPDDYYTVRDPTTVTGLRVNLKTAATPQNKSGV